MTICTEGFEIFIGVILAIAITMVNGQMMQIIIVAPLTAELAAFPLHRENETTNSVISLPYQIRPTPSRVIAFAGTILAMHSIVRCWRELSVASHALKYMIESLRCVNALTRTIFWRESHCHTTCKRSATLLTDVNWQKIPAFPPQPIPPTFLSAKSARSKTLHHANFNPTVFALANHCAAAFVIALPRTKLRRCAVILRPKRYATVLACVCSHQVFRWGKGQFI